MKFKKIDDVKKWLDRGFLDHSKFDGCKHYLVFDDAERGGKWTLMRYDTGVYTMHGMGEGYCDSEEKEIGTDELARFIWKNRKYIHIAINPVE